VEARRGVPVVFPRVEHFITVGGCPAATQIFEGKAVAGLVGEHGQPVRTVCRKPVGIENDDPGKIGMGVELEGVEWNAESGEISTDVIEARIGRSQGTVRAAIFTLVNDHAKLFKHGETGDAAVGVVGRIPCKIIGWGSTEKAYEALVSEMTAVWSEQRHAVVVEGEAGVIARNGKYERALNVRVMWKQHSTTHVDAMFPNLTPHRKVLARNGLAAAELRRPRRPGHEGALADLKRPSRNMTDEAAENGPKLGAQEYAFGVGNGWRGRPGKDDRLGGADVRNELVNEGVEVVGMFEGGESPLERTHAESETVAPVGAGSVDV
jgi:hypothetical protein